MIDFEEVCRMGDRVILHCDLNCFFASVELLSHPDLRDIPTAVCGDPASRHGIILAKNEPAKRLGIQTAETIWQAKKKCPGLVLLPPHHGLYREYSRRVNAIYEQYTDLVEPFGIDESWLDITGSMHLFGGDPKAIANTLRRRLRQELGLDRPFLERYVSWLGDFVRGDMGSSYNYSMPVSQMLQGKIPVTGLLTLLSFLLIVVLSIPLGLFTARHSGGALDKALTVVNQVLMAVPAFFTGILLTYLFGLLLRWFVPGSFVSPAESFWQSAGYLVFPAAAIAIPRIAMTVKMLRSALLAEMNKDYVRTSYSRGNDRRATLYLHVLRNALPPVVSFLAMTVADIVAGSVVIEQVFAIPGLGRLLLTSISNRDYPVVQAIVVLVAFWVVLVNLLGDLLNQRLDPRLRLTD